MSSRGPFLSFPFSISPFYSSSVSFPSLFSCNAQAAFKHPVSPLLLLLLPLGLHPLYRGFISPLWLCFLLPFVSIFPPFPFSSPFSRFLFFFLSLLLVWGIFPSLLPPTWLVCHPPLRHLLLAYQPLQSLLPSPYPPQCCIFEVRWSSSGHSKLQTDLLCCSTVDLLRLGSSSAAGAPLDGSAIHPHHGSAVVPCGVVTRGRRSWVLISLRGKSPLAQPPAVSAIVENRVGAHQTSLLYSFK